MAKQIAAGMMPELGRSWRFRLALVVSARGGLGSASGLCDRAANGAPVVALLALELRSLTHPVTSAPSQVGITVGINPAVRVPSTRRFGPP